MLRRSPWAAVPLLTTALAALVAGCGTSTTAPASCQSSRECSSAGLVCDTASMTCVECLTNVDCLDGTSVCLGHQCTMVHACVSSRECAGQVCDTTLGYCVDCVMDVDCTGGQVCEASVCVAPPTTCVSDRTCSAMGQVCDLVAGVCVDCVRSSDCTGGATCVSNACVVVPDGGMPPPTDELDLLLMIDNSNSMTEEQASVVEEIPRIVQIVTSGDRDGDGVQDFTPAASLHLGIVDSDMGLGDVAGIATCDTGFGDDGLLQTRTRNPATGCLSDYGARYPGHVFVFAGGSSPSAFAMDVGCVAAIGTDGCGFEFELESPLKALSLAPDASGGSPVSWTAPGYVPPTFYMNTTGHGGDAATNGAFLRPSSVLAIVTVNDEDDCSTPNYAIFSPDDPRYVSTPLNLRCFRYDTELFTPERYVSGFAGLRATPERLVFAAITGVPPDLSGLDPHVILTDPRMVQMEDPSRPTSLLPVCTSPGGRGVAYPAVRMTRVAEGLSSLGAFTTVQSICNSDFGPAFDVILDALAQAL